MNTLQKVFDNFKWDYKYKYEDWIILYSNRDRHTFLGRTNKPGNDEYIIVKQIKMNKYYDDILREIYFYACCTKNKYFNEALDIFLSEDCRYLHLILITEGCDLKDVLNYINDNDNENKINMIPFIIFQLVSGLKILHKNNLSHNDIKLSNINISEVGKVKISGFISTAKVSTVKYGGTNGYLSPQALLGKSRTKEDDMWSAGVVYLELFKNIPGIFYVKINGDIYAKGKLKLQYILENFYDIKYHDQEWNENINYKEIINYINKGEYNEFESKLKTNLLTGIDDENKEIIKKLLEIDPDKRLTAEQFLNMPLFKNLGYKFENSEINYSESDYKRYFENHKSENLEEFKKYLEEIKEKFFGLVIND
jgi:serine/threonine protein kinase